MYKITLLDNDISDCISVLFEHLKYIPFLKTLNIGNIFKKGRIGNILITYILNNSNYLYNLEELFEGIKLIYRK